MPAERVSRTAVWLAAVWVCASLAAVAQEQRPAVRPTLGALVDRFIDERRANRAARVIVQPAPQAGGGVLVPADRRVIQRLRKAGELIERQSYVDATRLLQAILERSEDAFYHPDPNNESRPISLKRDAERLIGTMPDEGRRVYELQYGATASAMLDAAGDAEAVAEVARRYFSTAAGRRATYRVGSFHFDRGRPLAAALCFARLLSQPAAGEPLEPALSLKAALCWQRAGMPDKSRTVLTEMKKNLDGRTVRVGEKDVSLFANDDDALAWLTRVFGTAEVSRPMSETDWAMFRGNAARNGVMETGNERDISVWPSPRSTVYDVTRLPTETAETKNDSRLKQAVRDVAAMLGQQQRVVLPRSEPLLVGDTLYVRTIGSILALEASDGATRWETFFDQTLGGLLKANGKDAPEPAPGGTLHALLGQRIWSDATWGTMSSDGNYLYAIEELGLSSAMNRPRRQPVPPARANALVAYYLAGSPQAGQRAWTLGGAVGDPPFENPQAGTFFLGAPLPLGGQLYCLAEVEGEIRLLAIDPAHPGEPIWSQPLVGAALPIDRDALRRQAGTAVSYADGVLVCPTDAGYVVAVDLTRRSLLWAFRYQTADNPPVIPIPRPRRPRPAGNRHWIDPAATIADGKVLLTPRSGHEVICLNLLDGSIAWRKAKKDGLYLAGVVDGKVLLVGSNSVEALSLADGSAAWKKEAAIAEPSGRGFVRGGRLYLPLSTAEIGVIEIATGVVALTVKAPRGIVPGNLIAIGDVVVSQGVDSVDVFALPGIEKKVAARDAER